jgi:hypothetical protein
MPRIAPVRADVGEAVGVVANRPSRRTRAQSMSRAPGTARAALRRSAEIRRSTSPRSSCACAADRDRRRAGDGSCVHRA